MMHGIMLFALKLRIKISLKYDIIWLISLPIKYTFSTVIYLYDPLVASWFI